MAETKKQAKSSKAAAAATPVPVPAAPSASVGDSIRQTLAAKSADDLPGTGVGGAPAAAPAAPPPPSAAASAPTPGPFTRTSRKPDPELVNVFLRQLSVLLSAGIPLMRALQILSTRSESVDFRASLTEVMGDVERGIQLWAALAKHPRWKCLTGFGLGRVTAFEAELDREERIALERGVDFDREMRAAQLYGFAQVPFDDSGRFVLPDRHFRLGGLADAVYFQGGGLQFTLWNPEELARMGPGWEDAQEACLDLAAKARAGKAGK